MVQGIEDYILFSHPSVNQKKLLEPLTPLLLRGGHAKIQHINFGVQS